MPRAHEVAGSNPAILTFCGECRWNYIVTKTVSPPNYGEHVSSSLVAAFASEAQVGCASAFQTGESGFESHHSLFACAVVAQRMQQPSRKRQDVGSIPTGGFWKLGDRLIGRMADSDPVDRGSNPRLPVGFLGA
jgi:hypothetical protein